MDTLFIAEKEKGTCARIKIQVLYEATIIQRITQAQQFISQGQLQQAQKLLLSLLEDYPDDANGLFLLAQVYLYRRDYAEAILPLQQCIKLLPQQAKPLLLLAQVFQELDQLTEAQQCYQRLMVSFPENVSVLFNYVSLLQSIGDFEQAILLLWRAIQLQPKLTVNYLALSALIDMGKEHSLIESMEQLLIEISSGTQANKLDLMRLHYALGKAMSDQAQYDKAFLHWRAANKIQLSYCNFRVKQMAPFFSQLKKEFKVLSEQLETPTTHAFQTSETLIPIFIVGLPRSGSTLLEQMLSCHTEIETVGEVGYLGEILSEEISGLTGKEYPLGLAELNDSDWLRLGQLYLDRVNRHKIQTRFVIDKLPANFQSIGAIRKALPMAKIIHIKRNPMAVAVSIFSNYFSANEPYFCDLNELGSYYGLYTDLMAFWQSIALAGWYSIEYESLVNSTEEQLQQILQFLELPWQSQCLSFHEKQGRVMTLSDKQVRQPIYKDRINSWKIYQQHEEMKLFAGKISG